MKYLLSCIIAVGVGYGLSTLNPTDDEKFKEIWDNDIACVKHLGTLRLINTKFKEAGLGYVNCSNSTGAKMLNEALGVKVVVVDVMDLPIDVLKLALK